MKTNLLITSFAASAFALSSSAAVLNVARGDWNTGSNWDTTTVPTSKEQAQVNNGRTATINGGTPTIRV